jgi:hypothetical protein
VGASGIGWQVNSYLLEAVDSNRMAAIETIQYGIVSG